jgi:heme oxygenase
MDSLLEQLRHATRTAHHQLDHHPLLQGLVRPGLDLPGYAQALAALHGPLAGCEKLLAPHLIPTDFPLRHPDLEADLADLGHTPWPLSATLPNASQADARLGILYVLEGACLGAAFIHRSLSTRLPEAPLRFFGTPSPKRWARFQKHARQTHPLGSAVIEGALATFACYHQHLNACLALSGYPDDDLDGRPPVPGTHHYGPAGGGR